MKQKLAVFRTLTHHHCHHRYHHFYRRRHLTSPLSSFLSFNHHQLMSTENNATATSHRAQEPSAVSVGRHNRWRFESIHNPIWKDVRSLQGKPQDQLYTGSPPHFHTRMIIATATTTTDTSSDSAALDDTKGKDGIHIDDQQHDDDLSAISQRIVLTPLEQKIFEFLLEVKRHFELATVLRVAGGWVRNKLLGLPGEDIDIALDDMMGTQFAERVSEYEKIRGMRQRTIGVIKANPDQSKHLESATTHIFDEPIDFVNLRSESYAEDSRIPTSMQLGTPEQDALRRDLTINALFYNLDTGLVEDATKKGIQDLQTGIVRTPLHPLQTFLDDPLRILRSVRFACTYNFLVADEIVDASHNANVIRALAEKVSRERVGTELNKILKGDDPVGGFALMEEMKILRAVFTLSSANDRRKRNVHVYENPIPLEWTTEQWNNALFRMRTMLRQLELKESHERAVLMLAAALSPIVSSTATYEQLAQWCDNLLCTSLRMPGKVPNDVNTVIYSAFKLVPMLLENTQSENCAAKIMDIYRKDIVENIVTVGHWLRTAKQLYPLAATLASVIHTTGTEFTEPTSVFIQKSDDATDVAVRGKLFVQVLQELNLEHLIDMRPLLNGNEVCKVLHTKPGPALKIILDEMLEWQMKRFRQTTSAEDAKQWLMSNEEELKRLGAVSEENIFSSKKKQKKQKKK